MLHSIHTLNFFYGQFPQSFIVVLKAESLLLDHGLDFLAKIPVFR